MVTSSKKDVEHLKRIGKIVNLTLQEMCAHVAPGISTGDLDEIGRAVLESHGAHSAPQVCYDFPGTTCICVNSEVAHGIPGERIIKPGDLVHIDVSAELDGYFADAGASVPVPPVDPKIEKLCQASRNALSAVLSKIKAGMLISEVETLYEKEARKAGFTLVRNLTGHGLGHHLHEDPSNVPDYGRRRDRRRFTEGMVVALEPFVSTGPEYAEEDQFDGWTLRIPEGEFAAQYEHTVIVTRGRPVIVTG